MLVYIDTLGFPLLLCSIRIRTFATIGSTVFQLQLVVRAAQMYNMFAIQMAATACLFNLSRSEIGQKLHPRLLGRIVAVDLVRT